MDIFNRQYVGGMVKIEGETVKYLDGDFDAYMRFLDEMCYYLQKTF